MLRACAGLGALVLLALGCGDLTNGASPREAAYSLVPLASSTEQVGYVGLPLPMPLQARVLANGNPIKGVSVVWSVNAGVVTPVISVSDANGIVSARWTLGSEPGAFKATAAFDARRAASVSFRATALDAVVAELLPETARQVATVATALPQKLRVRVTRNGAPTAGVTVGWTATQGTITASSTTNQDGVADAAWTLGNRAGMQFAYATASGAVNPPVVIGATATPGPATALEVYGGDRQSAPANRSSFTTPLIVFARDEFGNAVQGVPVDWRVQSGPVRLVSADRVTRSDGLAFATAASAGPQGDGIVRASSANLVSGDFTLKVLPAEYLVQFDTYCVCFRSAQNNTSPAVDTIPVGETVIWRLQPFDYDEHSVESVGTPLLPGGGDFPYASPSEIRMRFTQPGTYRYHDRYYGGTGVVVVR